MSGRAEAGGAARCFGEGVGLFKGGLDAKDDAELGDAVAGGDRVGLGGEVGEDDLELAAVAGVDDTGEGGEAADGQAGAVFDQGAVGGGEFEGEAGADGEGGAGLADGGEGDGLCGEEVSGEVSEGAEVGVAGDLGGGEEALDADGGGDDGVGHGEVLWWRAAPHIWRKICRRMRFGVDVSSQEPELAPSRDVLGKHRESWEWFCAGRAHARPVGSGEYGLGVRPCVSGPSRGGVLVEHRFSVPPG